MTRTISCTHSRDSKSQEEKRGGSRTKRQSRHERKRGQKKGRGNEKGGADRLTRKPSGILSRL